MDPSSGWTLKTEFKNAEKGYTGTLFSKKVPGYSNTWTKSDLVFLDCQMDLWDKYLSDIEN